MGSVAGHDTIDYGGVVDVSGIDMTIARKGPQVGAHRNAVKTFRLRDFSDESDAYYFSGVAHKIISTAPWVQTNTDNLSWSSVETTSTPGQLLNTFPVHRCSNSTIPHLCAWLCIFVAKYLFNANKELKRGIH
jgi:hypothetical protein